MPVFREERMSDESLVRCIRILSCSFGGIKPPCCVRDMRSLFEGKSYSQCVLRVKKAFGLPMTLRIGYLNETVAVDIFGNQYRHGFDFFSPKLLSSRLLQSCHTDRDREQAFLHFPEYMPLFHSQAFENATVTMFLRGWLLNAPFETFAYVVSHQMAHVILHATHHQLRYSEMATDLLAMISGFIDVAKIGRKNHNYSLGYLDDYQFLIAYDAIKRFLLENH
jgi:hypothetical protein